MSKLYQITMSDGMTYITHEKDKDEFYKQKFYEIKNGCLVVARDRSNINLFDLSKNGHVGLPTVLSDSIIRIQRVIAGSGLEALYLKVISNIKIVRTGNNGDGEHA